MPDNEKISAADSPCRGFCTTALGDDVCRSCGRTFEEVCNWIRFTQAEKESCWNRLLREGWIDANRNPLRGRVA